MLTNFYAPINKKTLLIGAVTLSLMVGGVALSGALRSKSAKDSTQEQSGQNTKVSVMIHESHAQDQTQTQQIATPSVQFVALLDANLSPSEKEQISRQIKNLEQTGSASGGVLTSEFKSATHAKMSYRFGRKQPLVFEMTKVKETLPTGFVLTGRTYEGVLREQGYDGVYRLFENPHTKARLEITENHIHPDRPLMLIKELFREDMDGVPLRFEQLTDKKGQVYYHGEFVIGERYVVMNSRGMNLPEFMAVVESVMIQVKIMSKGV